MEKSINEDCVEILGFGASPICSLRLRVPSERRNWLLAWRYEPNRVNLLWFKDGDCAQGFPQAEQAGELFGATQANPPIRTCENNTNMEFDSSGGGAAAFTRSRSIMRRFCMSGVSRQRGMRATSAQVTFSRSPSGLPAQVKAGSARDKAVPCAARQAAHCQDR